MPESTQGVPVVTVPERLDRRMRLGPFPSTLDALKFLCYAATGAILALLVDPWIWLPVALVGFGVAVWQPDDQPVDERLLSFLRWKLRALSPGATVNGTMFRGLVRQGLLEVAPHRYVAVVRTGGSPIAYLPPAELARRFESYRELLRSVDAPLAWVATVTPIHASVVLPQGESRSRADTDAGLGYSQLAELLCRRRMLRRIFFFLASGETSSNAIAQLEGQAAEFLAHLSALGLSATRLRDRALVEAARRFGWPVQEGAQ